MSGIIVIFVCGCAGCLIGVFFYKKYKERSAYFTDVVGLIETLVVDVRYRQDGLLMVLNNYKVGLKSDFSSTIESFLNGNIGEQKISVLNKIERKRVEKFFASLGRIDSDTQLLLLQGEKEEFTKLSTLAKEKFVKYGSMFIKLGFLLGIGIGILLI